MSETWMYLGVNAVNADIRNPDGRKKAMAFLKRGCEVITINLQNQVILLSPEDVGKRGVWVHVLDPHVPRDRQNAPSRKIACGDLKRMAGIVSENAPRRKGVSVSVRKCGSVRTKRPVAFRRTGL